MTKAVFTLEECAEIVSAFDAFSDKKDESEQAEFYSNSYGVYNLPQTLYYVGAFTRALKKVYPSIKFANTYTRCYRNGSYLGIHTDRKELDLTLSICIENTKNIEWSLNISNLKWLKNTWDNSVDVSQFKTDFKRHVLDVGTGIFCRGKEYPHWRDPLQCGETDRVIYVFYHWTIPVENAVALPQPANQNFDVSFSIKEPNAYVIDNFLTPQECEALIAAGKDKVNKSTVIDHITGKPIDHPNRTSYGAFFKRGEFDLLRIIEERISARVGISTLRGEDMQILRYSMGQEYKPHYDYFATNSPAIETHLKRGGQRVTTVIVYLNTPELGGATSFPDAGIEVAAKQGRALVFTYPTPDPSTKSLHGGMPVLKGEKWVITKWFRERNFI